MEETSLGALRSAHKPGNTTTTDNIDETHIPNASVQSLAVFIVPRSCLKEIGGSGVRFFVPQEVAIGASPSKITLNALPAEGQQRESHACTRSP